MLQFELHRKTIACELVQRCRLLLLIVILYTPTRIQECNTRLLSVIDRVDKRQMPIFRSAEFTVTSMSRYRYGMLYCSSMVTQLSWIDPNFFLGKVCNRQKGVQQLFAEMYNNKAAHIALTYPYFHPVQCSQETAFVTINTITSSSGPGQSPFHFPGMQMFLTVLIRCMHRQ